jgi:hypothetical protein
MLKMKKSLLFLLLVVIVQSIQAQNVGIGTTTPNASAQLDVVSTTKGLLIPRMTGAQRIAIAIPVAGLLVYQTNLEILPPSSPGFYLYESGGWKRMARADEISGGSSTWTVSGTNQYSNVTGSVSVGTSSPHASALLDIASTTKGVLIPRMTTAQRTAIASPAAGLMLYDTDRNLFYNHDGSIWRPMLDNSFWNRPTAASNYINNMSDDVGIGIITPAERLDVNGNIRSRNNLLVDNNITATGTSFLNGDVTTNSDLIINNTAAMLQLKSSSLNKGFFQLSGDNVRMGTNSGNSTGNLIIRMNGNDRVKINAAGDIDLEGQIKKASVTGSAPLLPLCYGKVGYDGVIVSGTQNFTVTRTATGDYEISCTGISENSTLFVNVPYQTSTGSAFYNGPNVMSVRTWDTMTGNREDRGFHFIVFGPN